MATQRIDPQVVSAVVPQFAPYDRDCEAITGHIAFVSQAPSIPGVMASACFFEGADSYQEACDYVDGMRKRYHAELAIFLGGL
jgi:hypothetical protein